MPESDYKELKRLEVAIERLVKGLSSGSRIRIDRIREETGSPDPELLSVAVSRVASSGNNEIRYVVLDPSSNQELSKDYPRISEIPEVLTASLNREFRSENAPVIAAIKKR